jgi:hypothetical protein
LEASSLHSEFNVPRYLWVTYGGPAEQLDSSASYYRHRFGPADQFDRAVVGEQQFLEAQAAVVVQFKGVSMN